MERWREGRSCYRRGLHRDVEDWTMDYEVLSESVWFPMPDVESGRGTRGEVCLREVWTWGRFWDLPFVRGIDLTGNDYSFSGLFWCIVKVRVFYFCGGVACRGGKGEIWGFRSRGDILAPVPLG